MNFSRVIAVTSQQGVSRKWPYQQDQDLISTNSNATAAN